MTIINRNQKKPPPMSEQIRQSLDAAAERLGWGALSHLSWAASHALFALCVQAMARAAADTPFSAVFFGLWIWSLGLVFIYLILASSEFLETRALPAACPGSVSKALYLFPPLPFGGRVLLGIDAFFLLTLALFCPGALALIAGALLFPVHALASQCSFHRDQERLATRGASRA